MVFSCHTFGLIVFDGLTKKQNICAREVSFSPIKSIKAPSVVGR